VPIRLTYVWGCVLVAIIIYALIWYTFGTLIMTYIKAVEGVAGFTGLTADVSTIIKTVIAWHPFLALMGWLVWGFLNSLRKGKLEYEM